MNNLIEIARIKELSKKSYVTKISQKEQNIIFNFAPENFKMEIVDSLIKKYRNEIKFSPGKDPYITYKIPQTSEKIIIAKIKEFLKILKGGSYANNN